LTLTEKLPFFSKSVSGLGGFDDFQDIKDKIRRILAPNRHPSIMNEIAPKSAQITTNQKGDL